jgi:hypothetical protein
MLIVSIVIAPASIRLANIGLKLRNDNELLIAMVVVFFVTLLAVMMALGT